MTIKIQSVIIEKDAGTEGYWEGLKVSSMGELCGKLDVTISEGKVEGRSEVSIDVVSDGLKEKLYSVLEEIEDELNGEVTKKYSWSEIDGASLVSNMLNEFYEKTLKKADEIDCIGCFFCILLINFSINLEATNKDQVEEFVKKFSEAVKRYDGKGLK